MYTNFYTRDELLDCHSAYCQRLYLYEIIATYAFGRSNIVLDVKFRCPDEMEMKTNFFCKRGGRFLLHF